MPASACSGVSPSFLVAKPSFTVAISLGSLVDTIEESRFLSAMPQYFTIAATAASLASGEYLRTSGRQSIDLLHCVIESWRGPRAVSGGPERHVNESKPGFAPR